MFKNEVTTDPTRLNVKTQTVLNAMKALPDTRAGVWLDDLQAAVSQDAEFASDAVDEQRAAAAAFGEVAAEMVAHYTMNGGCGNCGGLPHSERCWVGRFAALAIRGGQDADN